jgi:sulfofructose kinase
VDDIVQVPAFPAAGSKTHITSIQRQGGGQCATALVAAARLGLRCRYAGVLGRNELSDFVRQTLARNGIEVIERHAHREAMPCYSMVVVDGSTGERTILSYLRAMVAPDDIGAEIISASRCFFVDHHFPAASVEACRIARRLSIPIVADLERVDDDAVREVLRLAGHLILPWRVAREVTGEREAERAAGALWLPGRACAAVTDGARGCWFAAGPAGHEVRHQPAFPVTAVDTTGCGDVFHGAYAAALLGGRPPEQAIRFAAAAAALKARCPGGQAGCPDRAAVERFLSELTA